MGKLRYIDYSLKYIAILIFLTYFTQFYANAFTANMLFQNVWRFLTSPFNSYYEDDYLNNIVFVFFELIIVEIYFRKTKRGVLFEKFFLSAITSSYFISFLRLLESKIPSAGSSIVGSTLILALAFYLLIGGLRALYRVYKELGIKNIIGYFLGIIFAAIVIFFYYEVYIEGNSSGALHILGFIEFLIMYYILFVALGFWKNKESNMFDKAQNLKRGKAKQQKIKRR